MDTDVLTDTRVPTNMLCLGFFVRIPYEQDGNLENPREFRIGQVVETADDFGDIAVELLEESIGEPATTRIVRLPASSVRRCRILPGAPFVDKETEARGKILMAADDEWSAGHPMSYYALVAGEVRCIPETSILVGSTSQDPDPIEQLQHYELHHPAWRQQRNKVVNAIATLRNATYGMDELVGSRVSLLPHQAETIAKVLSSTQRRFILGDEVGLGKTIEAGVILKALRRRNPLLRVLIITPGSLVHQWQRELDDRFWIRLRRIDADGIQELDFADRRGLVVATETLASNGKWQFELRSRSWDLVIVDEAHQIAKDPELHEFLSSMSRDAHSVLLLSATPIQRRRDEYVALLRLLDPERYERISDAEFSSLLSAQEEVRKRVSYLGRGLDPDIFDADEVVDELSLLADQLAGDQVLPALINAVRQCRSDAEANLHAAREAVAYVSENYRIDTRIIRNRRAHLDIPVPTRTLDERFAYDPSTSERATLDALIDYLALISPNIVPDAVRSELTRLLLSAAASSAPALLSLISGIESNSGHGVQEAQKEWSALLTPVAPRHERKRIATLLPFLADIDDDAALDRLAFLAEQWRAYEEERLAPSLSRHAGRVFPSDGRLGRALAAITETLGAHAANKVLVFSSWPETISQLSAALQSIYGKSGVAVFQSGMTDLELQDAVDQFQVNPDCRVLLADELGGEGRNFQIASAIVHVDLPWTPALIEQRIGRVDRIGRSGIVPSIVITARGTTESDLLAIWRDGFHLFTRSMSGMEIALEGIQDQLSAAIGRDPQYGLAELIAPMTARAERIREDVEEERYADESLIDRRMRADFRALADAFQTGDMLANAIRSWASIAGLHSKEFDNDIVTYSPSSFGEASMANAKVVNLPNMQEALMRSRRKNQLEVRGTFNRAVAVKREDLVFFAPGSDPWTDFVIDNALRSDRGRCCAILRTGSSLTWTGIEFLFSIECDPRPLYKLGHDPNKLIAEYGYLRVPVCSVLISMDGQVESLGSQVAQIITKGWEKNANCYHLGQRSGNQSRIQAFQRTFPPESWPELVRDLEEIARANLTEEFSFLEDEAADASQKFAARIAGWRAASRWFRSEARDAAEIAEYEQISHALVEGIRNPLFRLESVCCWLLR